MQRWYCRSLYRVCKKRRFKFFSISPCEREKAKQNFAKLAQGLEVSVIKLKELNEEKRIDAEYFKKCFINNLNLFTQDKTLKENYIKVLGGKRLPLGMDFSNFGTPYIRAQDIKSGFTDFYNSPKVDNTVFNILQQYVIKNNNIALTIVGNLGDVAISKNSFTICLLTENCAKLIPTKNILPGYLYAFLKSKYGQIQITREKVGTAQPKLSLERIRSFKIHILPISQQKNIDNIVEQAWEKLQISHTLYSNAENLLLETLGLKNWQPFTPKINKSIRHFSFVQNANRMDAEYYQSKYEEMKEKIKTKETFRLGDIVSIQKSIEPGSDAYQTQGIPFIRIQDLSKKEIATSSVFLNEKYYNETLTLKKDTILFSKDGSIGIAYKVEKDTKAITSSAILHLTIKDEQFLPDFLCLYLNSIAVKMQAEQNAGGSIIQHWKPQEIKKIIVPLLPLSIQQQIANLLQQSASLRQESKDMLEQAKKEVEKEIEKQ